MDVHANPDDFVASEIAKPRILYYLSKVVPFQQNTASRNRAVLLRFCFGSPVDLLVSSSDYQMFPSGGRAVGSTVGAKEQSETRQQKEK